MKKKNKQSYKSPYDPFGSYTGQSIFDENEKPMQDADDL
jgi:hypothetical protein